MTIGDKIRSMNDEELAKLLTRCIDANRSIYDDWDYTYTLPITERLTLELIDTSDLIEELGTQFFNSDGSFPEVKFCSEFGTITT
jgi:hypothetical protein